VTREEIRQKARNAVATLEGDLCDHRGLRQAWERIDADTRESIRDTWRRIIVGAIEGPNPPTDPAP
jgi:hypothetical protein